MTQPKPLVLFLAVVLVVVLGGGCACGAAPSAGASAGGTAAGAGTASAAARAYSVHEWGLVRGGAADTLEAHTIGPGPALRMPLTVLKPVLYFHVADPGRGAIAITTSRVTAVEGEIREHFPVTGPYATPYPPSIDWGAFRVEPGACATPLALPTLGDPPCSGLPPGEPCEAAALATVVTSDADCVLRAGVTVPFLFYRSSTRGLTVPLRVTRTATGDLEITNDGELPIPGRIVRIQRSGGVERVVDAAPPAPHATITVGATWSTREAGVAAITAALVELGLSADEAAAFHRAWDTTIFVGPNTSLDLSLTVETIPTLEESIVYFLPAELTERIATIELDPAPTEIRRAMAVWTSF